MSKLKNKLVDHGLWVKAVGQKSYYMAAYRDAFGIDRFFPFW